MPEHIVAFLTSVRIRPRFPPFMGAFVIFHQVAPISLNTNLPRPLVNPIRTIGSIYDSICPNGGWCCNPWTDRVATIRCHRETMAKPRCTITNGQTPVSHAARYVRLLCSLPLIWHLFS